MNSAASHPSTDEATATEADPDAAAASPDPTADPHPTAGPDPKASRDPQAGPAAQTDLGGTPDAIEAGTQDQSTRSRSGARLFLPTGFTWRSFATVDAAVCLAYLVFAFWIFHGLWPDPATRAIAENPNDQALIEWFLAHGVLVWTGDFSLVTDRLNSPDGVNLMSNASHLLHGVLMAPVTVLFGAAVSFAILTAVNLAATAAGWYLLLSRTLNLSRAAAIVAGAITGFGPGMIAQSNSHLHMTAQWLVPPIVWCVIHLTRVTTLQASIRTGIGLAALVSAQVFLGEEVLFLTALTLAIFGGVYAICRRDWFRQIAPLFFQGISVAVAVATVVLAYPLWTQFAGPQHTPNAPFGAEFFYADIASFGLFSPLSLAGSEETGRLATSASEYNTYLGLPLLFVVFGAFVWRWRSPVMRAALAASAVMTLLSFGPNITINTERTGWPGLYSLIANAPVISGALPTRYALALLPLIAMVLAFAIDAAARSGGFLRVGAPVAVVAALIPITPLPLAATDRTPIPQFIATGAWRQCAPDGGVIVPVPLPTPIQPDLMRWPATANVAFGIPEGFFIGPYGPNGLSSIGTYPRPTSILLAEVSRTGVTPAVDDAARAQAQQDLSYWKADCVALAQVPHERALRLTLEQLLGPGTPIEDTWTWRITR